MAVTGITKQGLASIAISVAMLWGCLIGERMIVRQAVFEQARALNAMKHLREPQPVSAPLPLFPRTLRPKVG